MKNFKFLSNYINKKTIKKALPVIVLICVLGAMIAGVYLWEKSYYKIEGDTDEEVEEIPGVIRYDDKWYVDNDNLEKILFIGIDKTQNDVEGKDYQNDQQADFLLLAIINKEDKTVSALQINRDTMVDVTVKGLNGDTTGTENMQIALSHAYGSGGSDSCLNTVKAAENLLYGIEIDHYVALTMDGIQILNDSLGGIKVKIEDDFSKIDKSLVKGTEVTLKGEQALTFIRSRGNMEDSTNINRMNRQRAYMTSLYEKLKEIVKKDDEELLYSTVTDLSDKLTTDYTVSQITSAIDKYAEYDFTGFESIAGTADDSKENLEFYADDERLKDYVLNTFFVEQNEAEK